MAEGAGRGRRPGNSERHEVVRESRDGEARGPNLFGGRGRHQASGRGLLVRHRAPHGQQASLLGMSLGRTRIPCSVHPSCTLS